MYLQIMVPHFSLRQSAHKSKQINQNSFLTYPVRSQITDKLATKTECYYIILCIRNIIFLHKCRDIKDQSLIKKTLFLLYFQMRLQNLQHLAWQRQRETKISDDAVATVGKEDFHGPALEEILAKINVITRIAYY